LVFLAGLGLVFTIRGTEETRQELVKRRTFRSNEYREVTEYKSNPGLLIFTIIILLPLYVWLFGNSFLRITHPFWIFLAKSWLYILVVIALIIIIPLILLVIYNAVPNLLEKYLKWKVERKRRKEQIQSEKEEKNNYHEMEFRIKLANLKESIRDIGGDNQEGEIQVMGPILTEINELCGMRDVINKSLYDSFKREIKYAKKRVKEIMKKNRLDPRYKLEIKDLHNRLNDI
jgi:uncharacterized membrane protein